MRFVKPYLESIDGVSIYPIISILIFFSLFLVIGIWVLRMDKNYVNKMSRSPLADSESDNIVKNSKYNN